MIRRVLIMARNCFKVDLLGLIEIRKKTLQSDGSNEINLRSRQNNSLKTQISFHQNGNCDIRISGQEIDFNKLQSTSILSLISELNLFSPL